MFFEPTFWIIVAEVTIVLCFSVRVIMRRMPVGTSLAWLTVIMLLPLVGAIVYFLVGEKRLGYYRAIWATQLAVRHAGWRDRLWKHQYQAWAPGSDPQQLSTLTSSLVGSPPLAGHHLELMDNAEQIFESLIEDIEQSRESCFLEYYIWESGGLADDVARALVDAAARGVDCRVLVDAVGSRKFLRSHQASQLERQGVEIRAALPASLFRGLFYRFDLRLHRKIAVFDNRIAYVGSQNMADPKSFNEGAGYGQWVDAMVRLRGPAVDALCMIFAEDWQLESIRNPDDEIPPEPELPQYPGSAPVQVIPSGPATGEKAIQQTLINAIYMADQQLILTTPYFVPDEDLQLALLSAVQRGVAVSIVIPEKVNSKFVEWTSRPFVRELVEAGVTVGLYQGGLLHTKSVVVDQDTCMFGSLNLDPRSLHLNFEITLTVYDGNFVTALIELQRRYLKRCHVLKKGEMPLGSFPSRLLENSARLLSPLL